MDYNTIFESERKIYKDLRLEHVRKQMEYDKHYYNNPQSSITKKCKRALDDIQRKENSFIAQYAQEIYDHLSKTKPVLLKRATKTQISWEEAFGEKFSEISPNLYGTLVALIELDGGQYRIIE